MSSATIRLRPKTHAALKQIAAMTGKTLQDALDQAVEDQRRRLYLEGLNADYAALKKDPQAWADFKQELAVWDVSNRDGLEDD
jgi:hypothetical protein